MRSSSAMRGGQELPSLEEVLAGALRNPKERQRVLRLETELQNKMFKASPQIDRMEMQPMSAHNRELVSGIARRFKLSVQVSDKPGDGNSETAQSSGEFKSVLLLKTPEACMPEHLLKDYLMPLSEKNPSAAVDAPAMSMAAMSLSEPSKISPTSAEPKVQLLRRESRVQNDRRKPPPKHTPEEEEARMKQKLEDYEAARSRIFGSEAPPPDTTSSSKGEGSPTPRRSSSEGSRLARCGGIDGDEGGSSLDPVSSVGAGAEGGNDCGSKRATNRSLSQRSQDMNDPDFNRRRWAPANQTVLPHYACGAGYSMPLQCGGGSPYGVGGYVPVAGGVHSMGGSGCGVPMYSQCAGSQAGGTQLGHPMQCVSQPWQQPFLSSSSGQFAPISAAPGATGGSQGVSQVPVAPYNCFAAIGVGAGGGTMQGGMLPPACSMAIAQAQNQQLPAAQLDGYGPPPLQPQPQQLQPQQLQPQLLQQQQPIVGMPKLPLPVSDGVVSGAGAGAGAYSGCLLPIPDYKAMGFLSTSPLQEQAQLPGPQE